MARNREPRSPGGDQLLVGLLFFAPVAIAMIGVFNDDSFVAPFGIVLGGLYTIGVVKVWRRLNQLRAYRFRIALTGRPHAGKTVFSALLFDSLMNGRVPGAEFTAESRSAISVYQAIRNLPSDIWPKSTSRGSVSVYAGTIGSRKSKVDLEVGDSAGEYWLDLSDRQDQDSGYLEYMLSAKAIAHVIPLDELLSADLDQQTVQDVDDLKLVARLRRKTQGNKTAIPLLIVLSKADLVLSDEFLGDPRAGLFQLTTARDLRSLAIVEKLAIGRLPELLGMLATQLDREFSCVRFMFSSAPVIARNRLAVDERGGDLLTWIQEEAIRPDSRGRRLGELMSAFYPKRDEVPSPPS